MMQKWNLHLLKIKRKAQAEDKEASNDQVQVSSRHTSWNVDLT